MHAWLERLDRHFPVRYWAWLTAAVLAGLGAFSWVAFGVGAWLALAVAAFAGWEI